MGWAAIADDENLFRHSLFPLSFQSKVFKPEKLWKLFDEADGLIEGSLAWQRFAPTPRHVHDYGCRLAFKINEDKRAKGNFKARNRHIYCGAYGVTASSVRALAATAGLEEIASADVVHRIEDGEISHVALKITLKAGDHNVEATKTAIIDRLWHANRGPLPCVCDEDRDLAEHPSALLATPSGGTYIDGRGHLRRTFDLVRFRVYEWVWQIFIRGK